MAVRALTLLDRCDRCGAAAMVATTHDAGELLWCAHHYRENKEHLGQFVSSVHESLYAVR